MTNIEAVKIAKQITNDPSFYVSVKAAIAAKNFLRSNLTVFDKNIFIEIYNNETN